MSSELVVYELLDELSSNHDDRTLRLITEGCMFHASYRVHHALQERGTSTRKPKSTK